MTNSNSETTELSEVSSRVGNIKYNSILLTEIIEKNNYSLLIGGLQDLFRNLEPIDYLKVLEVEKLVNSRDKQLFTDFSVVLPFISHTNFQKTILPFNRVFFNLGDHVDHIQISVHKFSQSYVLLDIRCLLNLEVSNELDLVINGDYEPILKEHTNSKGTYKEYISSERLKEREICNLRYLIKKEMIEFLSGYFEGKFIKNSIEDDYSIVPSIDIFSLDFAIDNLEEWCKKNYNLFSMFSINLVPNKVFSYNRYLLFKEERTKKNNLNYLIFARNYETEEEENDKTEEEQEYTEINPEHVNIINGLRKCPFSLIAVERDVELEENSINEINDVISEEMDNLKKDNIEHMLERRENIFGDIFDFEKFKIETTSYVDNITSCDFILIENAENKFFDLLKININLKLEFIENKTLKYSKQMKSNLDLKNIDYNRQSQERMLWLTIVVGLLTFIQVIGLVIDHYNIFMFILSILIIIFVVIFLKLPFIIF